MKPTMIELKLEPVRHINSAIQMLEMVRLAETNMLPIQPEYIISAIREALDMYMEEKGAQYD